MHSSIHLQVSIDDQTLTVWRDGEVLATYPVSTSAKGMGFEEGSNRTPTGRFRISQKIGGDEPQGTIFRGRVPVGMWDGRSLDGDMILSRILRLDGLDEANANTLERYVYIHATNREDQLGVASSHGCVRMLNADVMAVYEMVEEGDELEILPATEPSGRLMFIDCDSTLSRIEGIDELARARGGDVFARVVELTHAAMNGEVPISEVFARRMEMIGPNRSLCEEVAQLYIDEMVVGVDELLDEARERGWTPVILSGGFAPLIEPLAARLGVEHIEAVPIDFKDDGSYAGYGRDYPTTRNHGKNEVIQAWKKAMLPHRTVMIGDGVSDLETAPDVDLFVGFGGVVERAPVRDGCGYWLADMTRREGLWQVLDAL